MTREEAITKLKAAAEHGNGRGGDKETAHGEADDILCALLTALGYKDVVEAYHAVEKWYA